MTDLNGNIYFGGTFELNACILINGIADTLTSFGYEDIVFGKIDQDGQLKWIRHVGGEGVDAPTDIMIDATGDVFLSGIFEDTLVIEPTNLVSKDYIDSFIAKYDSLGNLKWIRQLSGLGSEYCVTMFCDMNGNLLCGGFFNQSLEFPNAGNDIFQSQGGYDGFLAKWNNVGALVGARLISGPDDSMVKDVLVDNNNRYYAIGTFSGMLIPDSSQGAVYAVGGEDVFIARYNHNGSLLWLKTAGSVHNDNAKCLTLGGNDKIIMTGEFRENLQHNGNTILNAVGGDDIFHLKFNKNGDLLHKKKHGNERNDFVFDAWIPVGQKIMMASDLKVYEDNKSISLANYEMLGNLTDILETSTDFNPLILSAVMPCPDNIYFIGNFQDTVIFDQFNLVSKGQEDLFIIKLAPEQDSTNLLKRDDADTLVFPNPTIPSTVEDIISVHAYPNPFNEVTQIIYSLPQTCQVQMEILDLKGNKIIAYELPGQPAGMHSIDVFGDEINPGNYYCRFYASGETISVMKIIKLIRLH
jgi:hypothetical protein